MSFILPYYLHTIIDGDFYRIVCVFLTSISISVVLAFTIALTKHEKEMIVSTISSKLDSLKKRAYDRA